MDSIRLDSLRGQLIELAVYVQRGRPDNDYLGTEVICTGRVALSSGDIDCPPHIKVGASILEADSMVKPEFRSWRKEYYVLQNGG